MDPPWAVCAAVFLPSFSSWLDHADVSRMRSWVLPLEVLFSEGRAVSCHKGLETWCNVQARRRGMPAMHEIRSRFLVIPLKHLHTAAYGWNNGPRLESGCCSSADEFFRLFPTTRPTCHGIRNTVIIFQLNQARPEYKARANVASAYPAYRQQSGFHLWIPRA